MYMYINMYIDTTLMSEEGAVSHTSKLTLCLYKNVHICKYTYIYSNIYTFLYIYI